MLAGSLEAAGLHLGEVRHASLHNRLGNKENASIVRLNNALLKKSGAAWDRPPAGQVRWHRADEEQGKSLIRPYLHAGRPWGFKDPRTVWTVEGWLRLVAGARMVGVYRHPSLVVRSLMARSRARSLVAGSRKLPIGTEQAARLWCAYNAELLRLQRKYRFPLLHFGSAEAFREDVAAPLTSFARSVGLAGPLDRFFDRGLVHQASPGPAPSTEARDLLARLTEVSRQGCAPETRDPSTATSVQQHSFR